MCGCVDVCVYLVGVLEELYDAVVYVVVTFKAKPEAEANKKRVSGNNSEVSKKTQGNATK